MMMASRRVRRSWGGGGVVAIMVLMSLLTSCDPCFGVLACSGAAYLAVNGQIVEASTGVGVDGVHVDVIRRGGVVVATDSLSTVTNGGGFWRVQFSPASAGVFDADVVVRTPGVLTYRVNDVRMQSSERGGDAVVLGPWVTQPYFPDVGEIYLRDTEQRVAASSITFARTSGIDIRGPLVANDTVHEASDATGRLPLLSVVSAGVFSSSVGNVVGTLTVRRSPTDSSIIDSLVVRSSQIFRDPPRVIRLPLGLSLDYAGQLYSRATGVPLARVTVLFQRTGGVDVAVPEFLRVTSSVGKFSMLTTPLARGTLNGRIIFTVPPARPETVVVSLKVFEGRAGPLYLYPAGAYFPYKGLLRAGTRAIEKAKVSVQRVSGIATTADTATTQTDSLGVFGFPLDPLTLGDVVVDFIITPPAPLIPITVRGVRLSATDRTVDDRLVGVYQAVPTSSSSASTLRSPRPTP